jgi:hypothetical protein
MVEDCGCSSSFAHTWAVNPDDSSNASD